MEETITCPLCGDDMEEEEGLLWCAQCGINDQSITFQYYKDRDKLHEQEWHKHDQSEVS